jgi:hypothetical protein
LGVVHGRTISPVRRLGAVAITFFVLSGCALGRNDAPEAASLEPQFAPSESTLPPSNTSSIPPPQPGSSASSPEGQGTGGPATTAPSGGQTPTTAASASPSTAITPTTGSITDKRGDVTLSVDRPPAWADLLGGTLTRRAEGYELRVKLGGEVPSTYERDRTINIASFYDVTGDGSIDYEVWVNLASGGWGGSYFDNTRRGANRINDDALAITPVGDELVITFPLSHLASAERMRWAMASEWGRYEVIGTAAAARDDAPDNDAAASFPS